MRRTTTPTGALPATAPVIEFFLHLVAMEWILVVFLRIQRKSMKEDYDRTEQPVVCRSSGKTSDERLSRTYSLSQIDRLELTAVYCNRRGEKGTTPQKDPFSQCEQLQENSHTGEKWIRWNTGNDWINDTKQNNKHNMFNVAANLKHVETRENINWRLVSALCFFFSSVSFFVVVVSYVSRWFLVHTLWLKFAPCSSHHRHVSCACWVTLASTSPSHSLSFSSYL